MDADERLDLEREAAKRERWQWLCVTCRHWYERSTKPGEKRVGECRAQPPIPVQGVAEWPVTRPSDWCDRWAARS